MSGHQIAKTYEKMGAWIQGSRIQSGVTVPSRIKPKTESPDGSPGSMQYLHQNCTHNLYTPRVYEPCVLVPRAWDTLIQLSQETRMLQSWLHHPFAPISATRGFCRHWATVPVKTTVVCCPNADREKTLTCFPT